MKKIDKIYFILNCIEVCARQATLSVSLSLSFIKFTCVLCNCYLIILFKNVYVYVTEAARQLLSDMF